MKDQSFKNVAANADSTMNQTTLSNPIIGYHTLDLLEGLKQSYWDTVNRIQEVKDITRIWEYQRNEKLKNLKERKAQIKIQFNEWSALVKEWVSEFPEKDALYGDIIVEYYCNINNYVVGKEPLKGALKLQDILDEVLCEKTDKNKRASNFKARIRTIALNLIESKM